MKKLYMLSTKLWVYLIELPLLLLLCIASQLNSITESLLKFYPLITVLIMGMFFIFIYFLRGASLSYEEIRTWGLFSTRDSALISKDKTLYITLRPRRKINLSLWGNDGTPAFDWQTEEDLNQGLLRQFSCNVIGGKRRAKKILKFFTVEKEVLTALVQNEGENYENDAVSVTTERKNELLRENESFDFLI